MDETRKTTVEYIVEAFTKGVIKTFVPEVAMQVPAPEYKKMLHRSSPPCVCSICFDQTPDQEPRPLHLR